MNAQSVIDVVTSYSVDRDGNSVDSQAFFYKLIADHRRYQSEVQTTLAKQKEYNALAEINYKKAQEFASKLSACNATRLSIALNYGCFTFEQMNDTKKAVQISENAINAAMQIIGMVKEDVYMEAVFIIESIRENQAVWKGEDPSKIPPFNVNKF